ncbi:uncharacterized protein KY384_002471 [Bacidia gigantensis]|uniref:uncharacterized protein n=1 Tax=Bacidia gigantensis TaxID=2732470 RepID=UPI001D03A80F|nr:uncharacterized protein KY384_002471 [Bacidia gigantensis]KAG8532594.1 hypothetical protein KY384_002471 [Bacidia gigantensis]
MALEHGQTMTPHHVPTPSETPFETPGLGLSQHSSRHGSTSNFTTPLAFPPEHDSYFPRSQVDRDTVYVEKRSSRRFTSDLDNSLIQQIHTLRLERDEKNAAVERLEETFHESKTEQERLSQEVASRNAETRSVKKQMQLLESGTLAALGDIAKERDDAMGVAVETRKRLEASNQKLRAQEEDAERAQNIKDKEQEAWLDDKRNLERKVHILESRLKTMVAEMVAAESAWMEQSGAKEDNESMQEAAAKGDTFSVRSNSRAESRISVRSNEDYQDSKDPRFRAPSRLSALPELGESTSSLSLADELGDNDSEQDEVDNQDSVPPDSPERLPEEAEHRARRFSGDYKARKMMGLPLEYSDAADKALDQHAAGIVKDYVRHPARDNSIAYNDIATQYSPPLSPKHSKQGSSSTAPNASAQLEHATRPKRVSIPSVFLGQTTAPALAAPKLAVTINASCQTEDLDQSDAGASSSSAFPAEVFDSSTQTTEQNEDLKLNALSRVDPLSMDIPFITIQPPASRPSSSHASVMLPPRTKNAGCQAELDVPRSVRSVCMQTEEIRVDKRPLRLPPRLASVSALTQPSPRYADRRQQRGAPRLAKAPKRNLKSPPPVLQHDPPPESPPISSIRDFYPGQNDDGPLNEKNQTGPRRPVRSDSIFAGFSDDDLLENVEVEISDDEINTAPPIRKTLSKVKDSWKLVPQNRVTVLDRLESASETEAQANGGASQLSKEEGTVEGTVAGSSKTFNPKSPPPAPLKLAAAKHHGARKAAPLSTGPADYSQRKRSPSEPSASNAPAEMPPPPFPVPTRSSSRKIPISASEGAGSPTPYSTSFFTTGRKNTKRKPPVKPKILRKTQSAAAVTHPTPPTELPPPLPASTASTASNPPSTPPRRPRNQFILPYPSEAEEKKHSIDPEVPQSPQEDTGVESQSQHTSVVDAIAQTMVGEWMWKYVRKRSSFGITENAQTDFQNGKVGDSGAVGGVRHKRWVWLAPYERAVIWSGKQPTSGPALLGKGGRKRRSMTHCCLIMTDFLPVAIQSVLDVKDETPLPKGFTHEPIFNRSILILTPDRALKVTAVTRERHYIWLTALSYLSASSQGMTDFETPSPEQQAQLPRPPSQEPVVNVRRAPHRDSIRVSKSKGRPSIGPHSFSSPTAEATYSNVPQISFDSIERPSEEAAEPPQIPRIAAHARKRSSTGPRMIPLSSLGNYPNNAAATASSIEFNIPTTRDRYEKGRPFSRGTSNPATTHTTMTRSTTDTHIIPNDFFDAVGTVRMEAFVQDKENHQAPKRKAKEPRSFRTRQGKKKDLSYWGVTEGSAGSEGRRSEDPFRGF